MNNGVNYFRVLSGGYLIVLAARILYSVYKGSAAHPALNVTGGAVFIVFGGWLIYREWRHYRDPQPAEDGEPDAFEGEDETEDRP